MSFGENRRLHEDSRAADTRGKIDGVVGEGLVPSVGLSNLSPTVLRRVADVLAEPTQPRARIGAYRIDRLVGEGGMGVVYLAEQEEPIRRTVALKLIKPGMDSRDVIARFQSERQALAMMNHRNVAKVLDAGTSDDGRPYFVMEHVPGKMITQYCDEHKYTIKQRLELFIQACEAVQHAHQKAILHRDLKPSNILVTGQNGDAEVKVIDFGVAKALNPTLEQQHTLYTQSGQLIGTPEYMSPEQAGTDGHGVDTRSDIYSLGVVLYELLIGALPFDPKTLRSSGVAEIQRIIREVDPPRLSTRLSTLGEDASEIARNRAMRLESLHRELRGELEWIPLKAMRKEPDRRYTSAQELAEDIRNYLERKPLLAGPESRIYRTNKFLLRHRAGVAASAAIVLLLTAGITFYIHSMRAEQAKALAALHEAERRQAETERANRTLKAVNEFFNGTVIGAAEPSSTRGRELSVREALDRAAETVGTISNDPAIEAHIRICIAYAYHELGHTKLALPHARRGIELFMQALGDEHSDTLDGRSCLGLLLYNLGEYAEAEWIFRDVLEKKRRVLGPDERRTITTISNLSGVLKDTEKMQEAEQLAREALERSRRAFGEDDPDTLLYLSNLGQSFWQQGNSRDAEPIFREVFERRKRLSGEDHPDTLVLMMNIAATCQSLGKDAEAETLYRSAIEKMSVVFGQAHPKTIGAKAGFGWFLRERNRLTEASEILIDALAACKEGLDDDHPETVRVGNHLAVVLRAQGRLAEADALFVDVIERKARIFGPDHLSTLISMKNRALVLWDLERLEEAGSLARHVLARQRELIGADHEETLVSIHTLGEILMEMGMLAEAAPLLAELHSALDRVHLSPKRRAQFSPSYGRLLVRLGRYAEAEPILQRSYAVLNEVGAQRSPLLTRVLDALIEICENTDRPAEAARWRDELQELRASTQPASQPATAPGDR